MRIVEAPRDGIEHPCNAVLRHAAAEQRIALECAECVVLDLGMRGRRALPDKVEIDVGTERRRVEQDEPDVDAQF